MGNSNVQESKAFGGKTVGTLGGGLTLYFAGLMPDNEPLKSMVFYASPIVAVFLKEWGGMFLYEVKLVVVSWVQDFKLGRVKKRIDGIPDHPDFEELKKDVKKEYVETVGAIIRNNIESVRQWSLLTEDKNAKIKGAPVDKEVSE